MIKTKSFTGLLVAMSITVLSVVSIAQTPKAQRQMARFERMKTYLALTDKQAADIQDLLVKRQAAAFPIKQDLLAKHRELRAALDKSEPSPAAIGQLAIAQRSLRGQLKTLNQKLQSDIGAKLTPEQQQKFTQLKPRMGRRSRRG